jgi:hypothetical protein
VSQSICHNGERNDRLSDFALVVAATTGKSFLVTPETKKSGLVWSSTVRPRSGEVLGKSMMASLNPAMAVETLAAFLPMAS